jgi:hypothetical protein
MCLPQRTSASPRILCDTSRKNFLGYYFAPHLMTATIPPIKKAKPRNRKDVFKMGPDIVKANPNKSQLLAITSKQIKILTVRLIS